MTVKWSQRLTLNSTGAAENKIIGTPGLFSRIGLAEIPNWSPDMQIEILDAEKEVAGRVLPNPNARTKLGKRTTSTS
jgi:hypothetical protein